MYVYFPNAVLQLVISIRSPAGAAAAATAAGS